MKKNERAMQRSQDMHLLTETQDAQGVPESHVSPFSPRARRDVLGCNPALVGRTLLQRLSSPCQGLPGRAWSSLSHVDVASTSRGGCCKPLLVCCVPQNACNNSGRVVAVFADYALFLQVSCRGVRSKMAGCVLELIPGKNMNAPS